MFTLTPPKPLSLFHHHHHHHPTTSFTAPFTVTTTKHWLKLKPISASSPSNPQVYQPFRPPPKSPLRDKFRSLDSQRRLEVLTNRQGPWYEYAPIIPSLVLEGFTPSSIEEVTGISGVEQNRLVVGAQVRDSLVQSKIDEEILSFFDQSGAELLYEIRLLSASQRASAARYIVENRFDAKGAQELARAVKDFPRRQSDPGWECFSYPSSADCLAFMYFRQSKEHKNPSDQRTAALERALEVAKTEKAKQRILDELRVNSVGVDAGAEVAMDVKVPVVRMKMGELSESSSVVVLPVCEAEEGESAVLEAPEELRSNEVFGVVEAEKGWKKWVVLPGWVPVMALGKGVVVAFGDARVLPWKVNRWYKEESILVVADRAKKEVEAESGFYLVSMDNEGKRGFKVERGSRLKELGVTECLGSVVLVVRPPKEEVEDQLADEDWE